MVLACLERSEAGLRCGRDAWNEKFWSPHECPSREEGVGAGDAHGRERLMDGFPLEGVVIDEQGGFLSEPEFGEDFCDVFGFWAPVDFDGREIFEVEDRNWNCRVPEGRHRFMVVF